MARGISLATFSIFICCWVHFSEAASNAAGKTRSWLGSSIMIQGSRPSSRAFGQTMVEINGNLYIFGGFGDAGYLNDVHRFSPATLSWTELTSIVSGVPPPPRSGQGLASSGGLMYVFAGSNGAVFYNDLYQFSPATLTWTELSSTAKGDIPRRRWDHGFTALDNYLYTFSGVGDQGYLQDFYRYSPADNTWTNLTTQVNGLLPEARLGPGCTSFNGIIYIFGGRSKTGVYFGDMYAYEVSTNTWTELTRTMTGTLPIARSFPAFTAADGLLYLGGGSYFGALPDVHMYNISNQTWTELTRIVKGSIPSPRYGLTFVALNKKVYSFGGGSFAGYSSDMYRLDPGKLEWAQLSATVLVNALPRYGHGFAAVDEYIVVFGGWSDSGFLNDVHQFEPAGLAWTNLTQRLKGTPPSPRAGLGLASARGMVYCFGGVGPTGLLNDLLQFDLGTLTWTDMSVRVTGTAPLPRSGHGFSSVTTSIGDFLFVFGGVTESGFVNDLHRLDITNSIWKRFEVVDVSGLVPLARWGHGFTAINNKLYVFGGKSDQGLLNDVQQFDTETLTWTDLSAYAQGQAPRIRSGAGFSSANGRLYVYGGKGKDAAGALNDLYQFDIATLTWTSLSGQISGVAPRARWQHGFAAVRGRFFAFGGGAGPNGLLNDLHLVPTPSAVEWPDQVDYMAAFIQLFDWDTVLLTASKQNLLPNRLYPCTLGLPCRISIVGLGMGNLTRVSPGSIICMETNGCRSVALQTVHVVCHADISNGAVIQVQGAASAVITDSNFSSCSSTSNGGAVLVYGGGSVLSVKRCAFIDCVSLGSGGAIGAAGAVVDVSNTIFSNCLSSESGGAISLTNAVCQFSESTSPSLRLSSSTFENCSAQDKGGAISVSSATFQMSSSTFNLCSAKKSGGALSLAENSTGTIKTSSFQGNVAQGLGGGAVYIEGSASIVQGLIGIRNRAPFGGGGMLLWVGQSIPKLACASGTYQVTEGENELRYSDGSNGPACTPCPPGYFRVEAGVPRITDCRPCDAGTYMEDFGASSCQSCSAGKYSTTMGANASAVCTLCSAGKYSTRSGSSSSVFCLDCWKGSYSTGIGSTSAKACLQCSAGTYQTGVGMTNDQMCKPCRPGTFSSQIGAASCQNCASGKYSTLEGANAVLCASCEAGMFSAAGASSCDLCGQGMYSINSSSAFCSTCPDGTFSTAIGATSCILCTPGTFSASSPSCGTVSRLAAPGTSYSNDENMRWTIAPPGATSIDFRFTIFNTEPMYDFVSVYSCTNASCLSPLFLATFSGTSIPPTQTWSSAVLLITWTSDGGISSSGWSATWCSRVSGATSCSAGSIRSIDGLSSTAFLEPSQHESVQHRTLDEENLDSVDSDPTERLKEELMRHENPKFRIAAALTTQEMPVFKDPLLASRWEPYSLEMEQFLEPMRRADVRAAWTIPGILCTDNSAAYGPCIGTAYVQLNVVESPTKDRLVYAGIPFSVLVAKQDFYNQTIVSDSTSIVLANAVVSDQIDSSVAILGTTLAKLEFGQARFEMSLKPSFVEVDFTKQATTVVHDPLLHFSGVDSDALQNNAYVSMASTAIGISLSSGGAVCPHGYVLALSGANVSTGLRSGVCAFCKPGTYSVNALAGVSLGNPSCLNCPAGGDCSQGGDAITFSVGRWIISDGLYRLVSCPPAHQLINSIQGYFAHDVQTCYPCLARQYVVNSSDPNHRCQDCPLGARCDGNSLTSVLNGSEWEVNRNTGVYVLRGCPAGYELSSLDCSFCNAGYYCIGGSSPSIPCPQGSFATSGSKAAGDCIPSVFVYMTVVLPMNENRFSSTERNDFLDAVAAVTNISLGHILIESITPKRRSSAGIEIACKIASDDMQSATSISSKLYSAALNEALATRGLPACTISSLKISGTSAPETGGLSLTVIAGLAGGGFGFFVVVGTVAYLIYKTVHKFIVQKSFLRAIRAAKPGDAISQDTLPYRLRKHYVVEGVLGKGALGSVVLAKKKQGDGVVAIKFILPENDTFNEREMRQLKREEVALNMFTLAKHVNAVHLSGVGSVYCNPDCAWFIMEYLEGGNMQSVLTAEGALNQLEGIKLARHVLAALKILHDEGLVHRDVKPANIMRCKDVTQRKNQSGYLYKLVDFGTVLGIDEELAPRVMHTMVSSKPVAAGTPPYMSPEMYREPERAGYPTDLWSLGVTLFQLLTGELPFSAESDLLWSISIAGNLDERAPSILDRLSEDVRPTFDYNLARVVAIALEKHVEDRYCSVDEMHDAVYSCLIKRGEASYSVFISYRAASEAPLARLLFDELNHSTTPGGHRVTVFWDAHRLVKGEVWEEGFAAGLLNSLCFFPLLSYGSTAPLAALPKERQDELVAQGWQLEPLGRSRLMGVDSDPEDNVLKEFLIAVTLLDREAAEEPQLTDRANVAPGLDGTPSPSVAAAMRWRSEQKAASGEDAELSKAASTRRQSKTVGGKEAGSAGTRRESKTLGGIEGSGFGLGFRLPSGERLKSKLQLAYPILVGRPHPEGHPDYPGMGNFFQVQAGGGVYPSRPSPPTTSSVLRFLSAKAEVPSEALDRASQRSVAATVQSLTSVQGCQLWVQPSNLGPENLTRSQQALIGEGYAGPPVDLPDGAGGGDTVPLTATQRALCGAGLDERQLEMLKAQVRYRVPDFHDVIDRAVHAHTVATGAQDDWDEDDPYGRRRSRDGAVVYSSSRTLGDSVVLPGIQSANGHGHKEAVSDSPAQVSSDLLYATPSNGKAPAS